MMYYKRQVRTFMAVAADYRNSLNVRDLTVQFNPQLY
jgi:hypothetical protein